MSGCYRPAPTGPPLRPHLADAHTHVIAFTHTRNKDGQQFTTPSAEPRPRRPGDVYHPWRRLRIDNGAASNGGKVGVPGAAAVRGRGADLRPAAALADPGRARADHP